MPVWDHLLVFICILAPFACIGLGGASESKMWNYIVAGTASSIEECTADSLRLEVYVLHAAGAPGSPLPISGGSGAGSGAQLLGIDKPIHAI